MSFYERFKLLLEEFDGFNMPREFIEAHESDGVGSLRIGDCQVDFDVWSGKVLSYKAFSHEWTIQRKGD